MSTWRQQEQSGAVDSPWSIAHAIACSWCGCHVLAGVLSWCDYENASHHSRLQTFAPSCRSSLIDGSYLKCDWPTGCIDAEGYDAENSFESSTVMAPVILPCA
jgi:hypothetical protein